MAAVKSKNRLLYYYSYYLCNILSLAPLFPAPLVCSALVFASKKIVLYVTSMEVDKANPIRNHHDLTTTILSHSQINLLVTAIHGSVATMEQRCDHHLEEALSVLKPARTAMKGFPLVGIQ